MLDGCSPSCIRAFQVRPEYFAAYAQMAIMQQSSGDILPVIATYQQAISPTCLQKRIYTMHACTQAYKHTYIHTHARTHTHTHVRMLHTCVRCRRSNALRMTATTYIRSCMRVFTKQVSSSNALRMTATTYIRSCMRVFTKQVSSSNALRMTATDQSTPLIRAPLRSEYPSDRSAPPT